MQQCHKGHQETEELRTMVLIALKSTFPTKSHLNIRCNSVTKASGDSGIKNKYSLPSNQHFQQSLIWTSGATVSQKTQETQELRTNTHCPQINISNKVSFEHQEQQCHKSTKETQELRTKTHCPQIQHFQQGLIWTSDATVSQKTQETQELRTNTHCPQINISNKVSFEHQVQQCHKSIRRLRIKNKDSLPSNQHFQQSLIWTSGATVSQKHQETQELRTNTHCPQINISNKVSFEHQGQQCHKSIRRLRN